jgi:hypothetical protein
LSRQYSAGTVTLDQIDALLKKRAPAPTLRSLVANYMSKSLGR